MLGEREIVVSAVRLPANSINLSFRGAKATRNLQSLDCKKDCRSLARSG